MELAVLFGVSLLISGAAIRLGIAVAAHLGIMDSPGGHKQHEAITPFVGGFGVMAVLVCIFLVLDPVSPAFSLLPLQGILVGSLAIFLTGLADDIWHLNFKPRFVVQALVALSMVWIGGVELRSLGELFPGMTVNLGWLSLPVTIFATIGLINAVNMIDGIDGLSGSVTLVSLALTAVVAFHGGGSAYQFFIVAMMGGIAGFLYYNLRYPGNKRARVFLGDNGSMLLGFLFAWLLIALSQGSQAAMTPVTALWLFALPLMDTVGVMVRRIWLGKSPFRPDRHHLHHLFVRAGYRVSDIVAFAAFMQIALGLVGVGGMLLGVPEFLMFWLFLMVFGIYFIAILRPWRIVPRLRRLSRSLGLPSVEVSGIFVGYVRQDKYHELLGKISACLRGHYDYQICVYHLDSSVADGRNVYCVVHVPIKRDDQLIGKVQRDALRIRSVLARQLDVDVRLFLSRHRENDLRTRHVARAAGTSQRGGDRRRLRSTLIYSMERGKGFVENDAVGLEVSVPPV